MKHEKATLLVVDDNEMNRDIMARRLKRESYEVTVAQDGQQTLDLAAKERFDLILLDIMMPGLDGYEVCARLQKIEMAALTPVIFVTALGDEQNKARAFAAGGVDYLVKPVDGNVLLGKVAQHLNARKQWQEMPKAASPKEERSPRPDFVRFREYLIERMAHLDPGQKIRITKLTPNGLYSTPETGIDGDTMATHIAGFLGLPFLSQINPNTIEIGVLPTSFCQSNAVVTIYDPAGEKAFVLANPFDRQLMDTLKRFPDHKLMVTDPTNLRVLFNPDPENATTGSASPGDSGTPFHEMPSERLQATAEGQVSEWPAKETPLKAEKAEETRKETSDKDIENVNMEIMSEYKDEASIHAVATMAGQESVVKLSYFLIAGAVDKGASDIHIEPTADGLSVRYRIDGNLLKQRVLSMTLRAPLTSRFKIMANMDISERRVPQDGRMHIRYKGRAIDLRMSSLPTRYGEKIVIRILDQSSMSLDMDSLGLEAKSLKLFDDSIHKHHGILLVTGPTGSGKTTTLYTALNILNRPNVNIVTVEDPVEYELSSVNQVQIHPLAGLTFPIALRAILRQDPNVIMIGEIRDAETADIAIKAALTGHLVFSTLHTNDAVSTVVRLIDMDIPPFLVSAALEMVAAQRLLRKLCVHCRKRIDVPEPVLKAYRMEPAPGMEFFQPVGCDKCSFSGYKGRVAVIEVLALDEEMKVLIAQPAPLEELRKHAVTKCGMMTLREIAFRKASCGITSLEEIYRVIG